MMSGECLTYIGQTDDGEWWHAVCDCGWESPPVPGPDDAHDCAVDHRLEPLLAIQQENEAVAAAGLALGPWGYADPLWGLFEDGVGVKNYAAPWWVPLAPLGPITECQAWAAFLRWWCEPKWSKDGPRVERYRQQISDVTWEFREDAEHPVAQVGDR